MEVGELAEADEWLRERRITSVGVEERAGIGAAMGQAMPQASSSSAVMGSRARAMSARSRPDSVIACLAMPKVGRDLAPVKGTRRATGLLRLVMMISSPAATACSSAESEVFAS